MGTILWFLFWIAIWGSYNVFFKWEIYKAGRRKHIFMSIFFLISTLLFYLTFLQYLTVATSTLIMSWLATTLLGFFFSDYFPFYKHIKNGKYYPASLPSNILLQQSMNFVAITALSAFLGSNYTDLYFGLVFFALHIPIIFFKWARLRYFYLILTFFAGILFSYLIKNYGNLGIFLSFLMHYSAYIPIFYNLRDERKM